VSARLPTWRGVVRSLVDQMPAWLAAVDAQHRAATHEQLHQLSSALTDELTGIPTMCARQRRLLRWWKTPDAFRLGMVCVDMVAVSYALEARLMGFSTMLGHLEPHLPPTMVSHHDDVRPLAASEDRGAIGSLSWLQRRALAKRMRQTWIVLASEAKTALVALHAPNAPSFMEVTATVIRLHVLVLWLHSQTQQLGHSLRV
jgi:hypothetical protein